MGIQRLPLTAARSSAMFFFNCKLQASQDVRHYRYFFSSYSLLHSLAATLCVYLRRYHQTFAKFDADYLLKFLFHDQSNGHALHTFLRSTVANNRSELKRILLVYMQNRFEGYSVPGSFTLCSLAPLLWKHSSYLWNRPRIYVSVYKLGS